MRKEPHHAAVVAARGEAADEVGLAVGDDAGQRQRRRCAGTKPTTRQFSFAD